MMQCKISAKSTLQCVSVDLRDKENIPYQVGICVKEPKMNPSHFRIGGFFEFQMAARKSCRCKGARYDCARLYLLEMFEICSG